MGSILSYKHGEGSVEKVDPRLWEIVQAAVAASPYDAVIRSGAEKRSNNGSNHNPGWAVDVTLVDPSSGKALPDYQNGDSFAAYEQYAQTARVYQQDKYPELDKTFRWGGYFSKDGKASGYGAVDLMHLDINPNAKGSMALGSWERGAKQAILNAYPGAATNGGLGGANGTRLVSQYKQTLAGSGGLIPPSDIGGAPIPANLTRGLDQKRMAYAAESSSVELPRRRPNPAAVAAAGVANTSTIADAYPASVGVRPGEKMTDQQVAELYKGMYPESGSPFVSEDRPTSNKSNTSGLVEPGNIDINKRQVVKNADGTISTERSMSFEEDGIEVLVPTVFDGKHHSDEEAIQHYRETGEHLGKFSTPEAANKYAQSLHQRQDAVYNGINSKLFVSQVAVRPEVIPSNTAKTAAAPFVSEDRPTSNKAVAAAPIPATMSPALTAARQRLEAARVSKETAAPVPKPLTDAVQQARKQYAADNAPRPGTVAPQTVTINGKTVEVGGLFKKGDVVYKIIDNGDGTGKAVKMSEINAQNGLAGIENLGDKSIAGEYADGLVGGKIAAGADQIATNAPVIAADLGKKATELAGNFGNTVGGLFGDLFGGKPATTAAPSTFVSDDHPKSNKAVTVAKPTAGASLSAPGAGLTAAQKNALTAVPKSVPQVSKSLPATLAAPGAGLTVAQKNAMTSLNGVSLNPTVTKGAALMGAGAVGGVVGAPPVPASPITRTAAPMLQPTVRVSQPVVAQPSIYQSGGYLYSKSGDGYVKVGKVGSSGNAPVTTSAKPSGSSSNSNSSSGRGITGNASFAEWAFG